MKHSRANRGPRKTVSSKTKHNLIPQATKEPGSSTEAPRPPSSNGRIVQDPEVHLFKQLFSGSRMREAT